MSDKLNIPSVSIIDDNKYVNPEWVLFFEKLAKKARIDDLKEFGTGAIETNGNWRITQSGNDLVIQRLESGTWTTKSTISA
jgi:hypothetical protein